MQDFVMQPLNYDRESVRLWDVKLDTYILHNSTAINVRRYSTYIVSHCDLTLSSGLVELALCFSGAKPMDGFSITTSGAANPTIRSACQSSWPRVPIALTHTSQPEVECMSSKVYSCRQCGPSLALKLERHSDGMGAVRSHVSFQTCSSPQEDPESPKCLIHICSQHFSSNTPWS